ncbi:MAG TPA: helix-turn-helix transcriptional regulator [Candidatus Kapabacteria bacterium]|nr:helix-turn-helix transcriptional regulator [Candidatus Kapabacteria bacterium]
MSYSKEEKNFLRRVGEAVREVREKKGLSQEELGFESGVHRTYVGAIERGERNLSLLSLRKITNALKVSVPSVLMGEDYGKK